MIVRPIEKGWTIYFHKAHALLAMEIGLQLDKRFWPIKEYLAAGMDSISEHDNNQPKWNGKDNLTSSGAPLDYRQRTEVDLEQVKGVARSAKYKSSFIELMVSLHFQRLYHGSNNLDVQEFLKKQEATCEKLIKRLNLQEPEVLQCYRFLRFCDDLSLALCQNDFDNLDGPCSIKSVTGKGEGMLAHISEDSFILDPWLFEEDEVDLKIEYYTVRKHFYASDEELKNELDLLDPEIRRFRIKKGD